MRHPATNNAIMKVREQCYEGIFEETPLKISKGHEASERAIPSNNDSYKQRNKMKHISATKAANLKQMYINYVPEERRPE